MSARERRTPTRWFAAANEKRIPTIARGVYTVESEYARLIRAGFEWKLFKRNTLWP